MRQRLPLLLALLLPCAAGALDDALYAKLLERHTREVSDLARTRVDYASISRSADWRRLLESLAASDPDALESRDAQLAFWINAYNILAIDLVARHYPVDSIRDIGSLFSPVWKRGAGRIGGRPYSLDEIEHGIVRPLSDPRVHAALVCASTSCPALRREPFTAERVDAQLDDAMRVFLADPGKGLRVDRASGTLHLSKVFDWFEEDFEPEGPVAFAARYAPEDARAWIESHAGSLDVEYFDYDWRLNGLR